MKRSEFLNRLTSETPIFFKNLQKWFIFIGMSCGSISTYILTINSNSKIGLFLASFGGFFTVIAPIIAQLPINTTKQDELTTEPNATN